MRTALAALLLAASLAPAQAAPAAPSLSYFKPVAGGYAWTRLEGARTERTIAKFQGRGEPQVSYDADATRAIVWLDPEEEPAGTPVRAWTVKLPAGPAQPLPLPQVAGEVENVVFSHANRPMVLSLHETLDPRGPKEGRDAKGRFVRYEGKIWRPNVSQEEGTLALAHAYRLEGRTWKHVEAKATSTGWDYAWGVDALKSANEVYPYSRIMRKTPDSIDPVKDEGLKVRLSALDPQVVDPEGEWGQVPTTAGPVWVWREAGEFLHDTSLIAWGDPGRPTVLPGLTIPQRAGRGLHEAPHVRVASLQPRGGFLLVTDYDGRYPRLYDVAAKKLVWSSDTVVGATLWPR